MTAPSTPIFTPEEIEALVTVGHAMATRGGESYQRTVGASMKALALVVEQQRAELVLLKTRAEAAEKLTADWVEEAKRANKYAAYLIDLLPEDVEPVTFSTQAQAGAHEGGTG